MAAFISSTWQGTSTRIPGERVRLSEQATEQTINQVLFLASPQARYEAKALMNGEIDELSSSVTVELNGLVKGYVRQSGAGR